MVSDRQLTLTCYFCKATIPEDAELNVDHTWTKCKACKIWQRLVDLRKAAEKLNV